MDVRTGRRVEVLDVLDVCYAKLASKWKGYEVLTIEKLNEIDSDSAVQVVVTTSFVMHCQNAPDESTTSASST